MFDTNVRKDLILLFCSFLFYFAFLTLNASNTSGSENQSFNDYDIPPELCTPRYENRIYRDNLGHDSVRCVKIGIPDIETYDKSCEELGLDELNIDKECV